MLFAFHSRCRTQGRRAETRNQAWKSHKAIGIDHPDGEVVLKRCAARRSSARNPSSKVLNGYGGTTGVEPGIRQIGIDNASNAASACA